MVLGSSSRYFHLNSSRAEIFQTWERCSYNTRHNSNTRNRLLILNFHRKMAPYRILRSYLLRCALFITVAQSEEVFNTTPPTVKTSFSCFNRPMGFYADIEANCKVYHMCDDYGNKFSYRCPEETAFRQDALICDHAHLVDCQATVHPSNRPLSENIRKDNATPSTRPAIASIDSLDDHRLSFSRSYQVIQRPDKSVPDKLQSGFVFSASLFLRNQDRARDRPAERTVDTARTCKISPKNDATVSTVRTVSKQFYPWSIGDDKASPSRQPQSLWLSETRAFARNKSAAYFGRPFESTSNPSPSPVKLTGPVVSPRPPLPGAPREETPRDHLNHNDDYRPYSETLRSIQANAARTINAKSTTEIPVHALTLSLKPLVPNELEYDPYYPKQPTSTEAYYTPSDRNGHKADPSSQTSPAALAHLNFPFEIPSVLPDLNTLEDLVDRRKLFYIPRASAKLT